MEKEKEKEKEKEMEKIREILTTVFHEVFRSNSIILSDVMSSKDIIGWDSMNHMILLTQIENEFKIKFKLKDLSRLRNVGDLVDIIYFKLNQDLVN
jgi:acyl carrier protein